MCLKEHSVLVCDGNDHDDHDPAGFTTSFNKQFYYRLRCLSCKKIYIKNSVDCIFKYFIFFNSVVHLLLSFVLFGEPSFADISISIYCYFNYNGD